MLQYILPSILGAATSGIFANKAADAQVDAKDAASAIEQQQYNQSRQDQIRGVNKAVGSINAGANSSVNALNRGMQDAVGILRNGRAGVRRTATNALNQQRDIFNPTIQNGQDAQGALMYNLGLGGKPEGYTDFRGAPGYDFRFGEGMRALEGSAASSGGLMSGATMRDAASFGQGLADQSHGNYMNQLFAVSGAGQQAGSQLAGAIGTRAANVSNATSGTANALSNLYGQNGANIANIRSGQGNARAGAYSGLGTNLSGLSQGFGASQADLQLATGNANAASATAMGSAINNGLNNYMQGNMFNQLMESGSLNGYMQAG